MVEKQRRNSCSIRYVKLRHSQSHRCLQEIVSLIIYVIHCILRFRVDFRMFEALLRQYIVFRNALIFLLTNKEKFDRKIQKT